MLNSLNIAIPTISNNFESFDFPRPEEKIYTETRARSRVMTLCQKFRAFFEPTICQSQVLRKLNVFIIESMKQTLLLLSLLVLATQDSPSAPGSNTVVGTTSTYTPGREIQTVIVGGTTNTVSPFRAREDSGLSGETDLGRIQVHIDPLIRGLRFFFKLQAISGTTEVPSPTYGATSAGNTEMFLVNAGDKIAVIQVWYSTYIGGMETISQRGRTKFVGSRLPEGTHVFDFTEQQRIVGVNIASSSTNVQRIGFIVEDSTPSSPSSASSGSLSKGAIAAIVVGSIFFVIIIVSVIVALRRKKPHTNEPQPAPDTAVQKSSEKILHNQRGIEMQ